MLFNKSLGLAFPVGIAMLAAAVSSQAPSQAATPSFAAAIAPNSPQTQAHVKPEAVLRPTPPPGASGAPGLLGATSTSQAAAPAVVTSAGAPVIPDEPHLTLREIDNLARNKLTRSLRGDTDTTASGNAPVTLKNPAPIDSTPAPMVQSYAARPRTTPVSFVGGYVDERGQHVLYEYNGAVYPARVGEKLLNGWVARGVDGLWVTVAEGKRTWRVPMSGGSQDTQGSSLAAGGALGDLSSPLPAGFSVAQPISSFGRQ